MPVLESLCNKVAGLPINIDKFLRTDFFIEHLRLLLFKAMFETCQRSTMKTKEGFY